MKRTSNMAGLMALALASKTTGRHANIDGGMVRAIDAGTSATLYTGENDPSISIDGNVRNFSQEGHIGKEFTLTLGNTAASVRTARLFAGYNTGDNDAAPGQVVDGAFNDVYGNPGLQASSNDPDVAIREFQRYVERNPTRVIHIRIQSDTESQVQQILKLHQLNPFNRQGYTSIKPGLTVTGNQYNANIADVQCDFQLDDKSDVTLNVLPGSKTTYTFFCGATLSASKELAVKAAVAKTNLAM